MVCPQTSQSAPKLNRVPIGKKKIKSPPIIYLDRRENLEPAPDIRTPPRSRFRPDLAPPVPR
jgi:hypothetical protein